MIAARPGANLMRTILVLGVLVSPLKIPAEPLAIIDIAGVTPADGVISWVYGAGANEGISGVPVAGAFDVDGDGHKDYAVAYMRAAPLGRAFAGEVDLVFGNGTIGGGVDTAVDGAAFVRFFGATANETAGSEIWMDDVTGDGLGDLLICRQNFSLGGTRAGAGALTIVHGGEELRVLADALTAVDLAAPPGTVDMTDIVGANVGDRLCIWTRTGDVTGDGVADIVVAADQEESHGINDSGAVYVIRGGAHLSAGLTVDLASFGSTAIVGHIARFMPAATPTPNNFHTGATCQIGDLDGNGRAEVMAASALNRAGAGLFGEGTGGSPDGTLYIAWDDNFPAGAWPAGYSFDISASPGARTIIDGENVNVEFGEEILGGLDYDDDGNAELFIGDLVGDASGQNLPFSGIGYVFYDAAGLRGLEFDLQTPPPDVTFSRIIGPSAGAIAADTAAHGDFNGDGIGDLAFASPHAHPQGRLNAGVVHIFLGRAGGWPAFIETAALPDPSVVEVVEIQGANGASGSDEGDTLSYSAAAGDVDGDGQDDLITNEMVGNGISPNSVDAGNLIVISGAFIQQAPPADPTLATVPLPLWALLAIAIGLLGVPLRLRRRHPVSVFTAINR